jgi:hypothetical protein
MALDAKQLANGAPSPRMANLQRVHPHHLTEIPTEARFARAQQDRNNRPL